MKVLISKIKPPAFKITIVVASKCQVLCVKHVLSTVPSVLEATLGGITVLILALQVRKQLTETSIQIYHTPKLMFQISANLFSVIYT